MFGGKVVSYGKVYGLLDDSFDSSHAHSSGI